MPEGACVIRCEGKRGTVWRIKYRDAAGRQVKETLGRVADGWTKKRAEAELRQRLVAVEREGLRKPAAMTFEPYAAEWLATYTAARGLKRSTIAGYTLLLDKQLSPALGLARLEQTTVERIERYLLLKRKEGLGPRTLNRHLNLLSLILGAAVRRGLLRANPVKLVERPREPRRRWHILTPSEYALVERSFDELIVEAEDVERAWREQARVLFLTLAGTGIRRGEALGLRWKAVRLADPDGAHLEVVETWVMGASDSPKSEAGERTIPLGERVSTELFEHRSRPPYNGEDDHVFVSSTGGPLDPVRYAKTLRLALARAGIEGHVRPFHDARHSSITNSAATGAAPAGLMARAGHSDFKTTQGYIDLAGVSFREDAVRLERRLWGDRSGTNFRYQLGDSESETVAAEVEAGAEN